MKTLTAPKQLFDLLSRAGQSHARIATHLNVSLHIVDSWSGGRRPMPLRRHQELVTWLVEHLLPGLGHAARAHPMGGARARRLLADLALLREVYLEQEAAHQVVYAGIARHIGVLAALAQDGPPDTWEPATVQQAQGATTELGHLLRRAAAHAPLAPRRLVESLDAITLTYEAFLAREGAGDEAEEEEP